MNKEIRGQDKIMIKILFAITLTFVLILAHIPLTFADPWPVQYQRIHVVKVVVAHVILTIFVLIVKKPIILILITIILIIPTLQLTSILLQNTGLTKG